MRQSIGFAKNAVRSAVLVASVAALAGLASAPALAQSGPAAELKPTAGNKTAGTVHFTQSGNKVRVAAEVTGLKPNAEHGFHVHEKGDCSAPDAMSAGGHFNPGGHPHAHHDKPQRHAGDMPNLKADANGNAKLSFETDSLSTAQGPTSVVGRAVVVHRDPDDFATQPTGNSGPRLACGVVAAGR